MESAQDVAHSKSESTAEVIARKNETPAGSHSISFLTLQETRCYKIPPRTARLPVTAPQCSPYSPSGLAPDTLCNTLATPCYNPCLPHQTKDSL